MRSRATMQKLSLRLAAAAVLLSTVMLAGCTGTKLPASVSGSESKVFEAPPYVVCGVARYDQKWIDENIESGIGAFGWDRPKPRPAALGPCAPPKATTAVPLPKRKPTVIQRIKARVTGAAPVEPVPYIAQPVALAPPAVPVAPAKPVDPLDDLLGPK